MTETQFCADSGFSKEAMTSAGLPVAACAAQKARSIRGTSRARLPGITRPAMEYPFSARNVDDPFIARFLSLFAERSGLPDGEPAAGDPYRQSVARHQPSFATTYIRAETLRTWNPVGLPGGATE